MSTLDSFGVFSDRLGLRQPNHNLVKATTKVNPDHPATSNPRKNHCAHAEVHAKEAQKECYTENADNKPVLSAADAVQLQFDVFEKGNKIREQNGEASHDDIAACVLRLFVMTFFASDGRPCCGWYLAAEGPERVPAKQRHRGDILVLMVF